MRRVVDLGHGDVGKNIVGTQKFHDCVEIGNNRVLLKVSAPRKLVIDRTTDRIGRNEQHRLGDDCGAVCLVVLLRHNSVLGKNVSLLMFNT